MGEWPSVGHVEGQKEERHVGVMLEVAVDVVAVGVGVVAVEEGVEAVEEGVVEMVVGEGVHVLAVQEG